MPADSSRDSLLEPGQGPFVGREAELACLHRMLEQVHAGRPGLVSVEGPAGIGKTALVDRFLDTAGERCLLRASGEETEASLAFGVLAQLVADAPVPLLSALAAVPKGDERPIDPLTAGAAFVDLLGQLQDPDPVVLLVDDAPWADRPSLQALTFALRRLRVDRVLALLIAVGTTLSKYLAVSCRDHAEYEAFLATRLS